MRSDSNEITREYFDSLLIEMRHIDSVKASSKTEIFGEQFLIPIATAALSHMNDTTENGMTKMAEGAKLAGALCFSGMGEKQEIDDMCETGAKVIKIIKPHADNADVLKEIRDAEEAGAFAVGMDIDHAFAWNGEYDCVCGLDMRPKSSNEIKSFIESTKLPFVIKGVLSVADAIKAVNLGAKGIIVSHHHGIMDYAVPPLMILPEIVKAVKGKLTIFVDCCIESGADAFKALALGADAVCVGRVIMPALKEEGAEGVCKRMQLIDCQLRYIMSRTGASDIAHIDGSVIHLKKF